MNENTENKVTTEADELASETCEETATEATQEAAETEEASTPELKQGTPLRGKDEPLTMEERMLEMLLREKHPDTLAKAVAEGKTIRGAWAYVVSVMKNAYIAAHGRVSGGMVGNPDVVVQIAERYLREYAEGTVEAEVAHTPTAKKEAAKKPVPAKTPAQIAEETAKAAAKAAKEEAKKRREEMAKKLAEAQMSLF